MSWPNSWPAVQQQQQPAGMVPSYPPPAGSAAAAATPSIQAGADYGSAVSSYNQWQWQQYQQQYAQWHAQYGEQYAQQTGNALPPVATPMPSVAAAVPTVFAAAPTLPSFPPVNLVAPPPPAEPHPDELKSQTNQQKPPLPEEQSAEEIAFDEQFHKWEQEFEVWKRNNSNHPDKKAYRDYEQKCEERRKKLLERREQLRRKRIEKNASQAAAPTPPATVPPPPPPSDPEQPTGNGAQLANVFTHASAGAHSSGSGIPGLDLISENPPPPALKKPKLEPDADPVVAVIDLVENDPPDQKPTLNGMNQDPDNRRPQETNVDAISSLLNDPKVNALLQLVGNTMASAGSNGGGDGAVGAATNPLMAALAQLTHNRSGGGDGDLLKQLQNTVENRPNGSCRNERSGPETARFLSSPASSVASSSRTTLPDSYDPRIPPPMIDVDLSQPPPMVSRGRNHKGPQTQRRDRWSGNAPDRFEHPRFRGSPVAKMARFDRPPPPLAAAAAAEYQIDPELGRPVAVPKPLWMTEDEYQEIYDRYEDVQSFDERKHKMELAIQVLRQNKIRAGQLPPGYERPLLSARGGMPRPLIKTEIKHEPTDEYFQPTQVFDYSNCRSVPPPTVTQEPPRIGRVIDYGHQGAGSHGVYRPNDRRNLQTRLRNAQNGSSGADENQFVHGSQRFDYNHSSVSNAATSSSGNCSAEQRADQQWAMAAATLPHNKSIDRSVSSLQRLAEMHLNPNPEESNPHYPCKFILMNDNRPNCLSTKRAKRPSSIRKQKLKQQLQQQQQKEPAGGSSGAAVVPTGPEPNSEPGLEELSSDNDIEDDRPDWGNSTDEGAAGGRQECKSEPRDDDRSESVVSSQSFQQHGLPPRMIDIEELLLPPGRFNRPPRICLLVRGLPGSGKSHLARLIKAKEQGFGGPSPRVLSLDDYFLVDKEVEERDPVSGKLTKVVRAEYEFDGEMEELYIQNLIKAFKRTISERLFNFVIVDCCNHRLEYYCEFHNYARSNGFKVYTCTMQTDVDACVEQNVHHRTAEEIQVYADNWAMAPDEHVQLNFNSLLEPDRSDTNAVVTDMDIAGDDESLPDVDSGQNELEHANASQDDSNDDSAAGTAECDLFASKWDNDTSEQNLARLDGTSKPLKRPPTLEDYLQLDSDDDDGNGDDGDGDGDDAEGREKVAGVGDAVSKKKKRVRWADVEERKAQRKMRQVGFVVGVTDWSRMMDPTKGSSALTQTKYIERVKKPSDGK
ncbi:uncharacterized protein LOC128271262 isoform X2 [Anopheles cruzii]|uniref:uncharacterized protein LOC128271262 isoform X2 n=1 Tax=Anopheles cruzii TaxID=68878 RepID=UPI0022EC6C9B|nr:uncharacterized protein LOC128271262 isoform X2 [Anopheles cruzii]